MKPFPGDPKVEEGFVSTFVSTPYGEMSARTSQGLPAVPLCMHQQQQPLFKWKGGTEGERDGVREGGKLSSMSSPCFQVEQD